MSALAAYAGPLWQAKQRDLCFLPLGSRTTSAQSPTPFHGEDQQNVKRRLLVIYIHGFIGSEDSFHSFPSHVHMQLKVKLAPTHVVHSKIYPRYKTYKAFHLARDNLSQWLSAHEGPDTDMILVGHSMGGLLASEVVLMVSNPTVRSRGQLADRFCRGRRCQDTAQPSNTTYLGQCTWMPLSWVRRTVSC